MRRRRSTRCPSTGAVIISRDELERDAGVFQPPDAVELARYDPPAA